MSNEQLADLTQPQRDRLAFVELRVRFIGEIRRQDLVTRFGIQSAAASRDLALYKDLAAGNIDYDPKGKSYVLGPDFRVVIDFPLSGCCCLRQWSVDCSPDHSLRGYEFRLWLKDYLALYGVKNAVLAPGYRSPDQKKREQ
jgi:hypothetical protein